MLGLKWGLIVYAILGAGEALGANESWFSLRYHSLAKGGVLMIPLAVCSVLALAFALERFIMMRPDKIVPLDFVKDVRGLTAKGQFAKAREICRTQQNPMAPIFSVALMLSEKPSMENAMIRSTVEDLGARAVDELSLKIKPLLVISNISPLLGLLGTVVGIIKAFNVVASEAGLGRADLLATGISEALITTATGLVIAIPTLACYHYFRGLMEGQISERMEISLRAFMEDLIEGRAKR
ncbi:MAG: MotA/TolQ/ExbB proton channel family protein [bacterium]